MIVGCGIDTEEIFRFSKYFTDFSDSSFINTILTKKEVKNYELHVPSRCLPLSFCCKEAVFKALGESWSTCPIAWKDIEILFSDDSYNNYEICLHGYALRLYNQLKATRIISYHSQNKEYVSFEIIILSEPQ